MNVESIALSKKGQFAHIIYSRTCKVKKGCPSIVKTTNVYNASIGRQYDALKVVKDAKCVKTTEEAHALNTGLRGFKWKNYPTILTSEKSGKDYIRIETNKNTKFKTTYTMNGKEVSRETISDMLLASEKKHDGEIPVVMNIPMDGISYIHW